MTAENPTADLLREAFPDAVVDVREMVGEQTVIVDGAKILEILTFLRDDERLQYKTLSDVTAVDFLGRTPRFDVVYHLLSMSNKQRVRLKVLVDDGESTASAFSVFPTANFLERETYDMFGIQFDGHPDLRRILMPEDWDGHPLRKDHPLNDEVIAFSHNQDQVYRDKPFAEE